MTDFEDNSVPAFFFEIEFWTLTFCQPYAQSWATAAFAVLRYAPQVITLLAYTVGAWHHELYLFLFGMGLTLSWLVNIVFNSVVVRAPRIATCPPPNGAALSWQVQQVAFFTTFALGYMALYRPRTKMWHIGLLVLFFATTVIGAFVLNYHYADAIVAGAAFGVTLAILYQTFLYYIIVPTFPIVMRNRIIRYMGYRDTLCFGETAPLHVVMLENLDREFNQRQLEREAVRRWVASQTF